VPLLNNGFVASRYTSHSS